MIVKFDAKASVAALVKDFGTLQAKQLPWALMWASNATVADAEDNVVLSMKRMLPASSRGRTWIHRHVKVMKQGSRLSREHGSGKGGAAIGIIPPGGVKLAGWDRYRGSLVAMMENGGLTPGPRRFGGRASGAMSDLGRYAIPIRRRGQFSPLPLSMYPINLGLSSRTGISKRTVGGALRGKQRTYMVPIRNSPGNALILQRYGKERDATQPLFWTQRETRVPRRPYFFAVVDAAVKQRFGLHFQHAMEQALWKRGAYTG